MNTSFLGLAVATVLTACGIETTQILLIRQSFFVATVLTACGIETISFSTSPTSATKVATVLTACGIETVYQQELLH